MSKNFDSPIEVGFCGSKPDVDEMDKPTMATLLDAAKERANRLKESKPLAAEQGGFTYDDWVKSEPYYALLRSLEGQDDCDECCDAIGRAAWNAAQSKVPEQLVSDEFIELRCEHGMPACGSNKIARELQQYRRQYGKKV